MKIIFDNEWQKETLLESISEDYCPREFGLKTPIDDMKKCINASCKVCWEKCLEMEVKGE